MWCDLDAKFAFAQDLIRQAGALIKDQLATRFEVEVKSDPRDLVTNVDKLSQTFLVERIREAYPDDRFLAEEEGLQSPLTDGAVWVIDPIDGTVNFIAQKRDFAVILAYFEDGVGRFGLIYDVMADRLYCGGPGLGVTCNGRPLPQATDRPLDQSLVACNTRLYAQNAYGLATYFNQSLGIRNYGCAGLSLARVLSGQLFAYASKLCPWDYLAASIMGQELGYDLLTLDLTAPDGHSRQDIIAFPRTFLGEIASIVCQETETKKILDKNLP